jgi:uncharacterized membrane protein (DUF106 family)
MKLRLPQFILIVTVICVVSAISVIAQPVLQERNRIKDFGKSLKKYEKKGEKETNKKFGER